MELTQAEKRMINALRQIDKNNPLGIDGYTGEHYIDILLPVLDGIADIAREHYQQFLKQSRGKTLIDLREAQRPK